VAINKDKIRAAAQKYLQKGQTEKAIKEYERLVEDDPKDAPTLSKLGHLQNRAGMKDAAIATYTKVAQFYSEQGFSLRAVATYKLILTEIDANQLEVNQKLAELYQQLGLVSDAVNQFRQLAQILEQAGKSDESVAVVKKLVDLDPDNVAGRIKLGETYAKQNRTEEARREFERAATFAKEHQRVDDFVKAAEHLLSVNPSDLAITRELANIYIQKGDARRALAKLQTCFKVNPRDTETLNLLASAFKDLGQLPKTLSVYKELARVHKEAGDDTNYQAVMLKVAALAPDDPDARAALADAPATDAKKSPLARIVPVQKPAEVLEVDRRETRAQDEDEIPVDTDDGDVIVDEEPEPPAKPAPALAKPGSRPEPSEAPAAAAPVAPTPEPESVDRMLTEADIYIKFQLRPKALDRLQRILQLEPKHREASEKYKNLLLEGGDTGGAIALLLSMAETAIDAGDTTRGRDDLEELLGLEPTHPAARALLTRIAPDAAALGEVAGGADDLAAESSGDEVPEMSLTGGAEPTSLSYEPSAEAAGIDLDAEEEAALADDNAMVGEDGVMVGGNEDDEGGVIGDNTSVDIEIDEEQEPEPEPMREPEPEPEPEPVVEAAPPPKVEPKPAPRPPKAPPPSVPMAGGIDDLLASAMPKKAPAAAPAPRAKAAPTAEVAHALDTSSVTAALEVAAAAASDNIAKVETPRQAPAAKPAREPTKMSRALEELEELERPEPARAARVAAKVAPQPEPVVEAGPADLSTEIEEIGFYRQQGLEDEANEALANLLAEHPGHAELLALQAELAAADAAPEPAVVAPESPELEAEINDLIEPEIEDMDFSTGLDDGVESMEADDLQVSFADVFDEFKKGVAKQVDDSDHETHFNLGIAYKEMGLVDDAIREFQISVRSPEREIGALTMIGLCLLERGNMRGALDAFQKGLNSQNVTPEQAVALRYEVGSAYEAMGRFGEARKFFDKVAEMDPEFRGVSARIEQLKGRASEGGGSSDELDSLLEETAAEKKATKGGNKISYV
jgi:pilus assembly protein FimV